MSLSRILQNLELQASVQSEQKAKTAKIAEHFSDRISHICRAKDDIILHDNLNEIDFQKMLDEEFFDFAAKYGDQISHISF
ncbi:hypothetical protein HG442_001140 [Candidatus Gracilibacteria bacterium]|nr:hypothetical protein [Candidatus Gracilibacteria bacterium]